MRHGRAKASRRTLQFFRLNAPHLKPPFNILLDGTFLVASIRNKVPLRERFAKTLQQEAFTCYVTRSTLVELEALASANRAPATEGSSAAEAADDSDNVFARARRYGLDECDIIESDDIPADDAAAPPGDDAGRAFSAASRDVYRLAAAGGEPQRRGHWVATQDDALAAALRARPHVPLFRLGRAVLLLEAPSAASRRSTGSAERTKRRRAGGLVTAEEREMLRAVGKRDARERRDAAREEREREEKRSRQDVGGGFSARRKKKAKGPNPLSCKRKK